MAYAHECFNESICSWTDVLAGKIIDLAYCNEGELDDLQTISEIYGLIRDIEREIACIESERDRQKEIASKLRKQWGEQFSADCDAAGIK